MKIDWDAVLRMSMHPTRATILEAIAYIEEPLSPSMLGEILEMPLSNVSYYVKRMYDAGMIDLVKTSPVRGAVEHFYALCGELEGEEKT